MSGDTFRLIVCLLASSAVAALIASLVGPRWNTNSPRYRRIGLASCGPLLVIVGGVWYAQAQSFPINPFLYAQAFTLLVLNVCVLYGLRSGK